MARTSEAKELRSCMAHTYGTMLLWNFEIGDFTTVSWLFVFRLFLGV